MSYFGHHLYIQESHDLGQRMVYWYISMSTKACTPKPICNPKGTNIKFTNTIITKPYNIKTK